MKAEFSFPHSPLVESLDSYKKDSEDIKIEMLADECNRINHQIKSGCKADTEIYINNCITEIEVINSKGSDLCFKSSNYDLMAGIIYPGSGWGMEFIHKDKAYSEYNSDELAALINRFNQGVDSVKPPAGKMQVLFMPTSLYTLTWRLASGMSSNSYYYKVSPIADKEEVRIFDSKITIFTDPLDDKYPGCRPFDDEGVVCHRHHLVENGVFKKRYNDLDYAARLREKPTGHGFKQSLTGKPKPVLKHLRMNHGHISLNNMINSMERGIILEGVLGAHSGNIANGDFSVGVNPALYVENGKIKGRIKDAMVSGNVYKLLKKVNSVEDSLHPCSEGWLPALLIDDVQVSV